jgi:hypothetical protein
MSYARYFVISINAVPFKLTKNGITKTVLELATKYAVDEKLPIRHGDFGRLECYCGIECGTYNPPDYYLKGRQQWVTMPKIKKVDGKNVVSDDVQPYNPKKAGELVRDESAKSFAAGGLPTGYYRNDGLLIWNLDHFEDLDSCIDEYGAISSEFPLYEEPYYFTEKYWDDCTPYNANGPFVWHPIKPVKPNRKYEKLSYPFENTIYVGANMAHNNIRWLKSTPEMIENIEHLELKNTSVVITYWTDVRGNKHYIVCSAEPQWQSYSSDRGYTYDIDGKEVTYKEALKYSEQELEEKFEEYLSNERFHVNTEAYKLEDGELAEIKKELDDGNILYTESFDFNYDEYKMDFDKNDEEEDDEDESPFTDANDPDAIPLHIASSQGPFIAFIKKH